MDTVDSLLRKGVMEMHSYSPIEPPDQIAKRLGLPENQIIKLDANENPYGVSDEVLQALGEAKYLSIYPDPAQKAIREAIAEYAGCSAGNIVAGAGADELIDLLCRLVLNPEEQVLTFTPTFSYYKHVVELNGGKLIEIPRQDDYTIDLRSLEEVSLENVKIVLLCSPNNPTGNMLEEEVLDFFLQRDLLVVVDEAYHEFARLTYAPKINAYHNLIVLRTFSKCFGLAGLRVGYGIMADDLQQATMKIKPPYSVNMAAEVALQVCLSNRQYFTEQVEEIIGTREGLYQQLKQSSALEVYPSMANYLLCKVLNKNAKEIRDRLEKRGILLRYFNTPQLRNHLRISIGTKQQIETLLDNLLPMLEE